MIAGLPYYKPCWYAPSIWRYLQVGITRFMQMAEYIRGRGGKGKREYGMARYPWLDKITPIHGLASLMDHCHHDHCQFHSSYAFLDRVFPLIGKIDREKVIAKG